MKKLIIFVVVILLFCSCDKHNDYILFDIPHVYLTDESGMLSEVSVDNNSHNLLTPVLVKLNASNHYYTAPISVEYNIICGDGLEEDVDYKIQYSSRSPIVFENGKYERPINIVWLKNNDFDPTKDCTLVIELVSSSMDNLLLGLPGTNNKNKSFKFIKTN